jgi:cbb3-type cytochrome oxidase subunit 3
MNKQADMLDSFWCLTFGIISMGAWIWIYLNLALPV